MGITATYPLPAEAVRAEAPVRTASRLALLDATRLVAAAGIVWVHVATSAMGEALYPVGVFGVPFYILVAVMFMARGLTRNPNVPVMHYVRTRFSRVYVPFLFWTCIYVGLTSAKAIATHQAIEAPKLSLFWAGGQEHLWFLPYLMVVTILGAVMVRTLHRTVAARWVAIALLVGAGAYCTTIREPAWVEARVAQGDMEFWRYGLRALPSVFWALAIALATCVRGTLPRTNTLIAMLGMAMFALALLMYWPVVTYAAELTRILRACEGTAVLLVALWPVHAPAVARVGVLGRHSYGIYLSHVVFVRIAVMGVERSHVAPSIWLDLAVFIFAFGGSLVLTTLLSRSRYTRWVLGE